MDHSRVHLLSTTWSSYDASKPRSRAPLSDPPLSLGIPASPLLRGAPRRPPPAEVCTRVPWQPWRQASARQCRPPPPFPGDERSPLRSHAPQRHAHVTNCHPPSLGIPASPMLQGAPRHPPPASRDSTPDEALTPRPARLHRPLTGVQRCGRRPPQCCRWWWHRRAWSVST